MFGRKETLENIEEQPRLDPINDEEVETVEDLTAALEDLSVERLRSPPADTIEKIQRIHDQLPEEAKPEYAQDDLEFVEREATPRFLMKLSIQLYLVEPSLSNTVSIL